MTLLELLGIEPDQVSWRHFASCLGQDTELWFDKYEADENVAKVTDEQCLSCPVMTECLLSAIENGEHGAWGGIFLSSGKMDESRNAHKTEEVWEEIREQIGEVL